MLATRKATGHSPPREGGVRHAPERRLEHPEPPADRTGATGAVCDRSATGRNGTLESGPGGACRTEGSDSAAGSIEFVRGDGSVAVDDEAGAARPVLPYRADWEKRIEDLRSWAAEDGDPFNSESERDFLAFVEANPEVRRGGLVLVGNGNLRAVWKGDAGARVGLQFLGGGIVQYVLFRRGPDADQRWPESGRDDFEGFRRRVLDLDLGSVVFR